MVMGDVETAPESLGGNDSALRRVVYEPIDAVVPAESNSKMHDAALLDDSLRRWGYTEPVLVDERTGRLVAGHGRLEQLKSMRERGAEPPDGIQVIDGQWCMPVVHGWASKDDREAAAYLIASNRVTERGGWDQRALASALTSLEGEMAGVGFDAADLEGLIARLDAAAQDDHDETTWDEHPPPDPEDDGGQRSLTLDYDLATFERVVEMAARARKRFGLDSNAALFHLLLERHDQHTADPDQDAERCRILAEQDDDNG